ncbi:MAG: hypothetical protein R3F11_19700 [Verrucomicrobiales bacterium]
MMGGYDMNQFGRASQGKLVEKKNVAEILTSGHGSPYVAQVSMANAAKLYQSILEGRIPPAPRSSRATPPASQSTVSPTTCPRTRRARPRFARHAGVDVQPAERRVLPRLPRPQRQPHPDPRLVGDEIQVHRRGIQLHRRPLGAHRARFRKHVKTIKEEESARFIHLEDMLACITQDDVVKRRVFDPNHRSFVPDFGVFIKAEINGKMRCFLVSRQMVLFAVERRKAWRLLQSKAGVENKDYAAQKAVLAKIDKGEVTADEVKAKVRELIAAELAALG